ncbi:hypothetical protein Dimus_011804 [Dionaea muscipula]
MLAQNLLHAQGYIDTRGWSGVARVDARIQSNDLKRSTVWNFFDTRFNTMEWEWEWDELWFSYRHYKILERHCVYQQLCRNFPVVCCLSIEEAFVLYARVSGAPVGDG